MDVLVPGAYTTVQDYPARIGQGHGIPRSGPMDDVSARSKIAPEIRVFSFLGGGVN